MIGGPIFVLTLADVVTGRRDTSGEHWVGLLVPPAMVSWGFLLPRIGLLFGGGEERFILEFLEHTLAARIERNGKHRNHSRIGEQFAKHGLGRLKSMNVPSLLGPPASRRMVYP